MALPNAKSKGFGDLNKQLQAGTVVPLMTTAQRDALAAADRPEGLLIYNTTTHKLNVRVAAAWEVVTSA